MYSRLLGLIISILFSQQLLAQTDSTEETEDDGPVEWLKGDMNEKHEYGIKLGTCTAMMLGGELENPRPAFGLNGSAYYRFRYTPKSAVQAEGGISLRGSNFANSAGKYNAIKLYYVDLPVMWVRSLNKNNTSHLIAGAQYSLLLNSSIFINPSTIADAQRPRLKKNDIMLLAGTQFYAGFVGFQLVAKYGLININNGLITGLNPAFKNKDIHNFVVEINLLF